MKIIFFQFGHPHLADTIPPLSAAVWFWLTPLPPRCGNPLWITLTLGYDMAGKKKHGT